MAWAGLFWSVHVSVYVSGCCTLVGYSVRMYFAIIAEAHTTPFPFRQHPKQRVVVVVESNKTACSRDGLRWFGFMSAAELSLSSPTTHIIYESALCWWICYIPYTCDVCCICITCGVVMVYIYRTCCLLVSIEPKPSHSVSLLLYSKAHSLCNTHTHTHISIHGASLAIMCLV